MKQFNYKSEDGEIELKCLKNLNDLATLTLGCPHKGSSCSFRITNLNKFSTEHKTNSSKIALAPSTYLSRYNTESDQLSAVVGITSTSDFDRLFDVCLTRLHVGETAQCLIKCYRSNCSYDVTIELVEILDSVELFDLNQERLEEICISLKDAGVYLFTQGYILDAFYKFSEAIRLSCLPHPRTRKSSQINFITTVQCNMASCHMKFGNWDEVIDLCNSVLQNDVHNVKALFRRGSAFLEIQEYEKAGDDLLAAKKLDPDNQAVKSKLVLLDERKKALDAKYAQAMKKYFS